ncbi:MAG: hypothetical protein WD052_13010 [Bacteroidales bacterium]
MTVTSDYSPLVNISSNFDGNDSITLTDSILFKYMIEIDTGKLFFADLYLGNSQGNYFIMRSDSLVDSLWLHPTLVNVNGDYELTLVAYLKSYTGSLADVLDTEFEISDTSWPLSIIRNVVK